MPTPGLLAAMGWRARRMPWAPSLHANPLQGTVLKDATLGSFTEVKKGMVGKADQE